MSFTGSAHQGVLHHYSPHLVAFEHSTTTTPIHTLIFVGGLTDGLLTVPFSIPLSQSLPLTWCLVQPLLSSSYTGWGTSSLDKDVTEISQCVSYVRRLRPNGKIILMGHSTGCQDVMYYLISPRKGGEERPKIDGGIMQASVSDREALLLLLGVEAYEKSVEVAQEYVKAGRGEDTLSMDSTSGFLHTPVCARRLLSLASPPPDHDGEDDFYSSDLPDERLRRTFGKIGSTGTPVSILFSGRDQFVPDSVDKVALVERWEKMIREGGGTVDKGSGIVKGANHDLEDVPEEVTQDLVERVRGFAERVEAS